MFFCISKKDFRVGSCLTLREKCPYSEFFCSVFSRIRTAYGDTPYLLRKDTPYLFVFSPNEGKYGPEKLRIPALLMQCNSENRRHHYQHKQKN